MNTSRLADGLLSGRQNYPASDGQDPRGFNVVRFADDLVFTFESVNEAERFFAVLPKRLAKFGLTMNLEKSTFQPGGQTSITKGQVPKPRFKFLGFEVRWIKGRNGKLRPAYNPRLDRMNKRLREIKTYLWKNRNASNHMEVLKSVAAVVRGWVNYFSIFDCGPRVWRFIDRVRCLIHKWFNRRGQNRGTRRSCASTYLHLILRRGL
jgi:hypothetical protein